VRVKSTNQVHAVAQWCAACAGVLALFACAKQPIAPIDNPWRLLPGRVEPFSTPAFREGRQCWVYLPPGYALSDRRYPVLYVNDGQWAFDLPAGMHLNRMCENLIRSGEIEPLIIVAIDEGGRRGYEYTPWPPISPGRYGGGDLYVRALRDSLKPEIDRRFRTRSDPANTVIAGESLGGLISTYAAFAYDSTFGKAGALSASSGGPGGSFAMAQLVRDRRPPGTPRRYFQSTGYPDDNGIQGMVNLLVEIGWTQGVDFQSNVVAGAEHSSRSWESQYEAMLRFLFPARGTSDPY
jgi:enterochelin esterase-like enzyme